MKPAVQHVFAMFLALAAIGGAGFYQHKISISLADKPAAETLTSLTIENSVPLTLRAEMSFLKTRMLVYLSHDSRSNPVLSVPENWQRQEIKGADFYEFEFGPPEMGFSRFVLPPSATVSFLVPAALDKLLLHHPSDSPLKVELITVNLNNESADRTVLLVGQPVVTLWNNNY